jgi:hypothetical protein
MKKNLPDSQKSIYDITEELSRVVRDANTKYAHFMNNASLNDHNWEARLEEIDEDVLKKQFPRIEELYLLLKRKSEN